MSSIPCPAKRVKYKSRHSIIFVVVDKFLKICHYIPGLLSMMKKVQAEVITQRIIGLHKRCLAIEYYNK